MFLLITIFTVYISSLLFKKASGTISVSKLNMMSWIFYYELVLQSVIGAVLVVYQVDHHYLIDKLVFDNSRRLGFYAIIYTMISFPLGMLFANYLFNIKRMKILFTEYTCKYIHKEKVYNDYNIRFLLMILSLISLCSVVYVLYKIGDVPLFKLLSGKGTFDIGVFKVDVSRNFQGNEYVKNILALLLTPFLSYVAYGYKILNNSLFNRTWFWTMFFFTILILTYNYAKSPLLMYCLGFVFYRVYLNGKLSRKFLLYSGLSLLGFVIGVYLFFTTGINFDLKSLFGYNMGITGRLILSQGAGTFLSFDLFPRVIDHIGFSSVSELLSNLFGMEYNMRSARLIMEQVNYNGVIGGTAGVINSLFIGEAWANFGWIGFILAPIYVGFIIQCLYLFLLKSPKTPFFISIFVWFSVHSSITGGFNDYFYNIQVLVFVVLIVFVYGIVQCIKYNAISSV